MPLIPIAKTILAWAWNNRKAIGIALLAASLVLWGYRWGSSTVQAAWDESARIQRELRQAAIDQAQASANRHSAAYQAEIALQKQTINQMERILHHEIARSYNDCTANADLVGVWRETFDTALRGSAQP